MLEDGKITAAQAAEAKSKPIVLNLQKDPNSLAPHYVEEIRRYLEAKYGSDQVHEGGLRVYTSLDMDLQKPARQALLDGLAAYERRHGWRGKLVNVVTAGQPLEKYVDPDWDEEPEVRRIHARGGYFGLGRSAADHFRPARRRCLGPPDVAAWTQPEVQERQGEARRLSSSRRYRLREGAVARCGREGARQPRTGFRRRRARWWRSTMRPGEIKAMVGGRDFNVSKFNRATQALRQVGSSFKPYVYTAVIDQGGSPGRHDS